MLKKQAIGMLLGYGAKVCLRKMRVKAESDGNAVFYSSASFNPQSHTEAVVNGSPSEAVALGFVGNGMQVTLHPMKWRRLTFRSFLLAISQNHS